LSASQLVVDVDTHVLGRDHNSDVVLSSSPEVHCWVTTVVPVVGASGCNTDMKSLALGVLSDQGVSDVVLFAEQKNVPPSSSGPGS